MSKIKIQGNASGTGVVTLTAPNTNTDRTITLPDGTGTLLNSDGDGSNLTGVGVAGITSTADATAITIDSSENVGINHSTGFGNYNGTGVKYAKGDGTLFVGRDGGQPLIVNRETDQGDMICLNVAGSSKVKIGTVSDGLFLGTGTGGNTKQLTITSDGRGLSQFTAKAWINFDGTGTVAIRDSHNVSSISDNGTGDYSIYFSNNMSNNNYSFTGFSGNDTTGDSYSYMLGGQPLYYTNELRFKTGYYTSTSSNWTKYDSKYINIQIFGD